MHAPTHARTHARMHTHMLAHTHTHAHIHTQGCSQLNPLSLYKLLYLMTSRVVCVGDEWVESERGRTSRGWEGRGRGGGGRQDKVMGVII